MRCLLTASVVLGLASQGLAHRRQDQSEAPHRKSLGFGPVHPHAVYKSNPYEIVTNGFMPKSPDADPIDVAQEFVQDLLTGQLDESRSFKIRKDSYTDKNTGVTHVYVRQVINGLEVVDGDINVNVKDGMVLSYGNSVRSVSRFDWRCLTTNL